MLARAHYYGVEFACPIEELAKVSDLARRGVLGGSSVEVVRIHIAQGHDVLAGNGIQVAPTPSTGGDDGDV